MDPQSASGLWMGGFALLVVGTVVALWVVLRTPVKILVIRTELAEVRNRLDLAEATVAKAARRAGIAERKAKKEAEQAPEPTLPWTDLPEADDGAPPQIPGARIRANHDPLDALRRHFQM